MQKPPRKSPLSQNDKFKAMAKELGAETSEAAFDAVLKRIGKATVPVKKKAKKPAK